MTTIDIEYPQKFQIEVKAKPHMTEDEIKQLIASRVKEVKVLNAKLVSNDFNTEVFIQTGAGLKSQGTFRELIGGLKK